MTTRCRLNPTRARPCRKRTLKSIPPTMHQDKTLRTIRSKNLSTIILKAKGMWSNWIAKRLHWWEDRRTPQWLWTLTRRGLWRASISTSHKQIFKKAPPRQEWVWPAWSCPSHLTPWWWMMQPSGQAKRWEALQTPLPTQVLRSSLKMQLDKSRTQSVAQRKFLRVPWSLRSMNSQIKRQAKPKTRTLNRANLWRLPPNQFLNLLQSLCNREESFKVAVVPAQAQVQVLVQVHQAPPHLAIQIMVPIPHPLLAQGLLLIPVHLSPKVPKESPRSQRSAKRNCLISRNRFKIRRWLLNKRLLT